MMNVAEQHQRLLEAARSAGPIVLALVELHAPPIGTMYGYSACAGCVGTIQGDPLEWPDDCTTTQLIAHQLGIELEYRWRKTPELPPPSRPGTAYPIEGYPLEVRVQGEHAAPEIHVTPESWRGDGVVQVSAQVQYPGGVQHLHALVLVTAQTRQPGVALSVTYTPDLDISLWWAEEKS